METKGSKADTVSACLYVSWIFWKLRVLKLIRCLHVCLSVCLLNILETKGSKADTVSACLFVCLLNILETKGSEADTVSACLFVCLSVC